MPETKPEPLPPHGGSWMRDDLTGELKLVEEPTAPPEPNLSPNPAPAEE